jgi:8-oxo-dGTP pyrophosphatase MutT (NUDIX family)
MRKKIDLVVAAFVFHGKKLLLVHHTKLDLWLPPGGHIEPNETPDDAARREVKEETGLDIEFLHEEVLKDSGIIRPIALPFYADVHNVGDHNHACLYYLCKTKNGNVKISHESKAFRWFTPEEASGSPDILSEVRKKMGLAFEKFLETEQRI